jgi:hypothetical protein
MVKENTTKPAPLSMDIIKFCYAEDYTEENGDPPTQEQISRFERRIIEAQHILGAENITVSRKAQKPISALLKKKVVR